ncbi:MAG: hypothetical protein AABZ06_00325 [Bdellovibrionota bacterium]
MKKLILTGVASLIIATNTFAHTLKSIKEPTNPALNPLDTIASKLSKENFFAANTYKVVKFKPEQKPYESLEDLYIRVLKSTLHRDFPITGDEDGYDLGVLDKNCSLKQVKADIAEGISHNLDLDDYNKLTNAMMVALQAGMIIITGSGSGNNTYAYIVAAVDTKNQELVYLISSNFGSDE